MTPIIFFLKLLGELTSKNKDLIILFDTFSYKIEFRGFGRLWTLIMKVVASIDPTKISESQILKSTVLVHTFSIIILSFLSAESLKKNISE